MKNKFKENELIIYQNGDRFEIGRIKRVVEDGAFVYYHTGDTASKTPFDCMHKLQNNYCITQTNLGGATPWIPVNPDDENTFPKIYDIPILLSFENYPLSAVGKYKADKGCGAFYLLGCDDTCLSHGLFVNAWMPLPEPYTEG